MFLFLMERETVIYKAAAFKGVAAQQYERDFKRRQSQGWRLVSCTESGKDWVGHIMLTAIYERGAAMPTPGPGPMMPMPGPAMNVQNLPLLLSMLSPQERVQFEAEVQAVVNRWLAGKAMGQQR